MRYRQNTKGDILYGPPVKRKQTVGDTKSTLKLIQTRTSIIIDEQNQQTNVSFLKEICYG